MRITSAILSVSRWPAWALWLGFAGLALFFVAVPAAQAVDLETSIRQRLDFIGGSTGAQLSPVDLRLAIAIGIRYVLTFVGFIFFLMLLYGGFTWMFSGGNEIVTGKAITIIQSAVIGLLIIMLSFTISTFIISRLQAASDPQAGGINLFEVDVNQTF